MRITGRLQSAACVGVWLALLAGCGRPAGEIFAPVHPPVVWPLPPEAARVRYVGQIHGGEDLKPARTGWQVLKESLNNESHRSSKISRPHALAVGEDDRVYVVDTGAACLHVFDLVARTHVRVESAGEAMLRSPVGVAIAGSSVYVSDAALGDVIEYDRNGHFRRRLRLELERPGGIAYCPEADRLYVVETGAHRCAVLSRDEAGGEWSIAFTFGQRGMAPGTFNFPTHIVYHRLLGLVVSDTLNFRVQRFSIDGEFVAEFGSKGDGAGDFSLPKGVAVDSRGRLFVVDAHFENVQVFDPDGRLLLAFGEEGDGLGQFAIPAGVTIDHRDRIWVADAYNRRLQVFSCVSEP